MELAKITSKGQITIPISIRKKLKLKDGDKIAFIENGGNFVVINPISLAIKEVRKEFEGEARRLDLKNEQDVVNFVKEMRKDKEKKVG